MNLFIKDYDLDKYFKVSIIVTDIDHHLGERYWLEVSRKMPNGDFIIDSASGDYKNARMLSEALRDAIGFGPARDLLRAHGVPEGDPLMYLGMR